VAIGNQAGQTGQRAFCVAIGNLAGQNNQHTSSIILNAQNAALDSRVNDSSYWAPMRNATTPTPVSIAPPIPASQRYSDYVMAYDPTNDLIYNQAATSTYEVSYGRHGMLLATFFMPDLYGSLPIWFAASAQGITIGLVANPFPPGPTGPLCQVNKYDFFLYNCTTTQFRPVLSGTTCTGLQQGLFVGNACDGIYAVLQDNLAGNYAEAAYLNILWDTGIAAPENQCNSQWSASVEWLQDPRSNVTIAGNTYKVMLLGANHSF
jgi:hypothetical protein